MKFFLPFRFPLENLNSRKMVSFGAVWNFQAEKCAILVRNDHLWTLSKGGD